MAQELKHFIVSDYAGNVQEGVACYVYYPDTNTMVTEIYDADGVPLTQPFLSGEGGVANFKAPDGVYDLVTVSATLTKKTRVNCLAAESFLELKHRVELIEFKNPSIDALLIDSAVSKIIEKGSTITSVTLSWTLSGATPTGQSINQGVGGVVPGTLSKVVNGPFSADRTWTLTVSALNPDGVLVHSTADVSIIFRQKRYWGVSASTSLTNEQILALDNEFATNRNKTMTYNATGGRYLYYAYPTSFGALANVIVGGFAFSDYTVQTRSFTNASGYIENYYLVRFNGIQTGSNIVATFS